jgi:hypothetical protein
MNDTQTKQVTVTAASDTAGRLSYRGMTFQPAVTPNEDIWWVTAEIDGLALGVHFSITGRRKLSAADFKRELNAGIRLEVDHYRASISAALAFLDRDSPHPALFTSETES